MLPPIEEVLKRRKVPRVCEPRIEALNRLKARQKRREEYSLALLGALSTMAAEAPPFDPEMHDTVIEALKQQYPEAYGPLADAEIIEKVGGMSPEALQGLMNVKGKLLELQVVQKLNDGASLGSFELTPGQHAELATAANQPGYDIIITNADGSVAGELSAKCSSDVHNVLDALERYPDYQVIGSSELAAQHSSVIDSGLTDSDLAETVGESLEAAGDIGGALDVAGDFFPGLPIMFVVGKHGLPVLMGKSTFEEGVQAAAPKLVEAGVITAVGIGLSALDMGLLSLPIMIGGKYLWGRFKDHRRAGEYMIEAYAELEKVMTKRARFQHS
jgi:hypothetical protein